MKKVIVYSLLLVAGLVASQFIGEHLSFSIGILTMVGLSFIMIHVGYEFEIDKKRPRQYLHDYGVAFTAAAFPWIFCALYFVLVLAPSSLWGHPDLWKESLLTSRFASPTSAGVLFSMLAAAGLAATWVFQKARILAIFDDLDTILLMIPLKMLMVGARWQLLALVMVIGILLWLAWRYLHRLRLPITWPYVMAYSAVIVAASEAVYFASKHYDAAVPIHLEVLLPAFVLGCMLARPAGTDPHRDDAEEGREQGPESPSEQRVATIVAACFMVLVGLSMPPLFGSGAGDPVESQYLLYEGVDPQVMDAKNETPGWGMLVFHVIAITVLSNLGKMFPAFCYRNEATFRERLAVSIGMWPRGEVGAGVLLVSLGYGVAGPTIAIAALCLALNLALTGVFIVAVKKLIAGSQTQPSPRLERAFPSAE